MTHLKRAALAYLSAEGEVDIKHVRSPNRTPAGALGDSDQAEHGPSALEAPQIPLPARKSLTAAIPEYLEDCLDRQGKSGYGLASRTHETYKYRLGFLTAFRRKAFLDEVDDQFLKAFRRFLRDHPENLSDRTSYNTMQAVSTFCSATVCLPTAM